MSHFVRRLLVAATILAGIAIAADAGQAAAATQTDKVYGPQLEGFNYPYPVKSFSFTSQGKALSMAYMDIAPAHPNGRTVVLFHGKNFRSASWDSLLPRLSEAGFRVIAPDQVSFCKSTKPASYVYTFHRLAANTHALLQSLGSDRFSIVAHSTGGMIGMRYAMMYPGELQQLVMISPIGQEDWKAKGVPWLSLDQWYARDLKTTADSLRAYESRIYYVGKWEPKYETYIKMYAGMFAGPGKDIVALIGFTINTSDDSVAYNTFDAHRLIV